MEAACHGQTDRVVNERLHASCKKDDLNYVHTMQSLEAQQTYAAFGDCSQIDTDDAERQERKRFRRQYRQT
jgi:hypothetical protein